MTFLNGMAIRGLLIGYRPDNNVLARFALLVSPSIE